MYWLQKIVGALTEPLILALALCLFAGLLRVFRPRWFKWCTGLAAGIAYLGSIAPVANRLQGPLEHQYPPLRPQDVAADIRHVVVLGSGYSPYEGRPITAELDEEGLMRAVEGVRLQRQWNIPTLIVSGGAPRGLAAPATGAAILARSLGVDAAAITVLDEPLDTAQEARAVAAAIGSSRFLLVTSAYHMPRAMLLMERAGAHAIPSPTGQRVAPVPEFKWRGLLPSSGSLRRTERALHEYLALLALKVSVE